MPVNITLDSGRAIDVADAANAQLVADAYDRLLKRVNDAETTAKASLDAAQAKIDDLTGKLEKATLAASDEAIKARVEKIAQAQAKAREVAGDKFSCDSVDPVEIMRAALTSRYPSRSFADKSAEYIHAAFDMASEEDEKDSKDAQYQQLSQDAAKVPVKTGDAYEAFKRKQANAYLGGK